MEATINEKAMEAIGTFLERKGYDIVERGWEHDGSTADFVAREDGDTVFVLTRVRMDDGSGFPDEDLDRGALERLAAAYLAQADGDCNVTVRFDVVSLIVLGDHRAFLRNHRNALSAL